MQHRRHDASATHPVRRPPGAARPDAAVGERQARQGVPRRDGRAARSAASSASASRSRTAGRTRCRARPRSASGWPTAWRNGLRPWFTKFAGVLHDRRWLQVGRAHLRLAPRRTSATCATSARWRGWRWSTRSRSACFYAPRPRSGRSTITSPACTTRWSRRASRSRWCTRRSSRPTRSTATRSSCSPTSPRCRTRSAGAPRVRRARRRARGDVRDVALRRVGARGGPTSASATCSASATPAASRARCRTPTCARGRAPAARHARARGLEDAPRIIHGVWRVRVTAPDGARAVVAADADPVLPRPADGGGLPARGAHRHAASSTCARSAAAASSTSRGTSTAPSGRC